MAEPLNVAFIWHMHQPYYKDTETGQYSLPWVRLHATKDYLHLAKVIGDYPSVHQTINVVPSLAAQILEYAAGDAVDHALELSRQVATAVGSLSDDDKRFILDAFFSLNWDHFLLPVPRYAQLARLREAAGGDIGVFSDQYWRDLVTWYNLAWIDPSHRKADATLQGLFDKGSNFTAKDILAVLEAHRAICDQVIPTYRDLSERGVVELTTSPYFHPILPLLVDTSIAREASPNLPLPRLRFAYPDDARHQLSFGVEFHEKTFGHSPNGLWPSEGAVSQAAVNLIGENPSLKWIATDEHILERALGLGFSRDTYGHLHDPRPLFQPYLPKSGGPAIFFRDQILSDRVGFVYQHWGSYDAANDLVERLLHADRVLQAQNIPSAVPPIVSIVLDGENCWEFYPNNGDDFLRILFERIGRENRLRAVTPTEYLTILGHSERSLKTIDQVPTGSWIASNLETWIGEPNQNQAWEYLVLARSQLAAWLRSPASQDPEKRRHAWDAMHVAEGSDWFWWYYSHNRVGGEATFDVRFREHVANIYRAIDVAIPDWLNEPIAGQPPQHARAVSGAIASFQLSANTQASVAWETAGFIDADSSTGAMQVGARVFRRLYFGYDDESVYARVEFGAASRTGTVSLYLGSAGRATDSTLDKTNETEAAVDAIDGGLTSLPYRIDVPLDGNNSQPILNELNGPDAWTSKGPYGEAVLGQSALELRLPRSGLRIAHGVDVHLAVALRRDAEIVEAVPSIGAARFTVDAPVAQAAPAGAASPSPI
jgi:alpha-amylase/alpha-mannosidase (GH57 family)